MSENTDIFESKYKRNKILWKHGLYSGIILGIAHSITPVVIDPKTFNLTDGFKSLITLIIASGVMGAATYLMKSPLPELPDEIKIDVIKPPTA